VLTLFLLVPGLLLRQEATAPATGDTEINPLPAPTLDATASAQQPKPQLWFAYLGLLCGSGYLFVRCLLDLALVRRPALAPNLNIGGLAWLGFALSVFLVAVLCRRQAPPGDVGFDSVVFLRSGLALAGHVAVVTALIFIGYRHFQDTHAGMAAATFYLLLPYTALFFDRPYHVLPMALVLWAVAAYPWPTVAGLLLGTAAGTLFFPAFLLPAWVGFYWRRGLPRFLVAFALAAGLGLGGTALLLAQGGPLGQELEAALNLADWQQWKVPHTEGFWTGVPWPYRIPVFIAYLAFALTVTFWPQPKNLAQLIALSAALLLGIQFWFADRGGIYVLWYLPLLLLLVFRPNLADRQASALHPENDWLHRLGRWSLRLGRRVLRLPDAVAPVQ